jgi:dihydropteroate synthase
MEHAEATACRSSLFKWGERTYVMGIVNASPDSFSGDGLSGVEAAVAQAKRMVSQGADIIDVGGESTRPQSQPVGIEEEIARVAPVIARLSREVDVPLSVDTYKYEVALAAVEAGANMLNDVWGLKQDERLAGLAAEHNLPIIITANERGAQVAGDIMAEIISELKRAVGKCLDAGVAPLKHHR